ncbi:MAG: LytR/AlgR family response regulator transcription factor [Acetatifactor sp.]
MSDGMKIAIVDDEKNEQEIIVKYISEWAEAKNELVEFLCFQSGESFLFSWEDSKDYNLLILDIEMGKMNGLELAKKIRLEDKYIPIMFITGYDEYIHYGYDVSALHYLIKPVNKVRLFQALDKLAERGEEAKNLILNSVNGVRRIQESNVLYVEAAGHGSVIHTVDEVISLKESLGEIEKRVTFKGEIIKCHRAYLVNLRFVSAIQNTNLMLDNSEKLPVSRSQMKYVQQEFLRYYKRK